LFGLQGNLDVIERRVPIAIIGKVFDAKSQLETFHIKVAIRESCRDPASDPLVRVARSRQNVLGRQLQVHQKLSPLVMNRNRQPAVVTTSGLDRNVGNSDSIV
jgi:hypothetical protein